jgi:hypothetical protein
LFGDSPTGYCPGAGEVHRTAGSAYLRRLSLLDEDRLLEALDDPRQLGRLIALLPGERDQLSGSIDDRSSLRRARDAHPPAPAELQQTLVTQLPQGPQHGVGIHAGDGSKVLGRG